PPHGGLSRFKRRQAACKGKCRLSYIADAPRRPPGLRLHGAQKEITVAGAPARSRGTRAPALRPPITQLAGADGQGSHGAIHGGLAQPPLKLESLSEANDAGKGVDHPKAAAAASRDQKPAVVGAQVEGSVDVGYLWLGAIGVAW